MSRLFAVLRQQPIALVALFVALGGTSFAAVSAKGPDSNVILGCVGDRSGQLRVVDSAARCGSRETAISFNREGDQGKTGARGKTGDDGTNGRTGAAGKDGTSGATGAAGSAGPTGATGQTGAPGADGDDGATGQTGAAGADGDTGPRGLPGADGADASDTPSELLTALQTVDGPSSGLDADTVDGVHAGALMTTSAFGALFGTGSQSASTANSSDTGERFCYIGEIWLTAVNYPPPNTRFVNGQSLSVTQNQALFALIAYTYGGSGANFNLPDLRSQAPGNTNYVMCLTGVWPQRALLFARSASDDEVRVARVEFVVLYTTNSTLARRVSAYAPRLRAT
jgi:hypothetical protein